MINDLDGYPTGCRFVEWSRGITVQTGPGFFVDFGFEGGFQCFIGIVGAQEVGMTDKETLFVVVGIDEPAGNAFSTIATDFAGIGMKDVNAVNLNPNLVVSGIKDIYIRFTEDDKQVSLAGIFEIVGHVQVGVHSGFEDRNTAEFGEFGRVSVVIEGAGDERIETGISGFACC